MSVQVGIRAIPGGGAHEEIDLRPRIRRIDRGSYSFVNFGPQWVYNKGTAH